MSEEMQVLQALRDALAVMPFAREYGAEYSRKVETLVDKVEADVLHAIKLMEDRV